MNNQFNNRIDNISIIQNISYVVASVKVVSIFFLNTSVVIVLGSRTRSHLPVSLLPFPYHHSVDGVHDVQQFLLGDVPVVVQIIELEGPCNQQEQISVRVPTVRFSVALLWASSSSAKTHSLTDMYVIVIVTTRSGY